MMLNIFSFGIDHLYVPFEEVSIQILCPFFFSIFICIQLQLYVFSPHPSTPPQVNPPPSPTSTLPLGFVHVSFIVVPVLPSSHCPAPGPAGSAGQALGRCANLCPFLINCILRLSFISFLKFFEY